MDESWIKRNVLLAQNAPMNYNIGIMPTVTNTGHQWKVREIRRSVVIVSAVSKQILQWVNNVFYTKNPNTLPAFIHFLIRFEIGIRTAGFVTTHDLNFIQLALISVRKVQRLFWSLWEWAWFAKKPHWHSDVCNEHLSSKRPAIFFVFGCQSRCRGIAL